MGLAAEPWPKRTASGWIQTLKGFGCRRKGCGAAHQSLRNVARKGSPERFLASCRSGTGVSTIGGNGVLRVAA